VSTSDHQQNLPRGGGGGRGEQETVGRGGEVRGTYDLDGVIPGGGSELVFLEIVPIHRHDLRRVLVPRFYR
jgi:hypothetical protein